MQLTGCTRPPSLYYDKLFASANLRDQAYLTALSHSAGASSGWLKAIPQSSLDRTIPGPEFVVGLHLWLGIPLFLVPPLCVCLSPIDCFGDHLLECSHGLLRIFHHNALVDIVCHALSQSHPGVLNEERVSCKDHSHPGDVYHPDFQCDQHLSVHSTTQHSYILLLLVLGLLLQLGSWPKTSDIKMLYRRQDVTFFLWWWKPLVCGHFCFEMLQKIADCTIARSGVSTKLARKHLLQQLSANLWAYNARMILRYWAYRVKTVTFPLLSSCCNYAYHEPQ